MLVGKISGAIIMESRESTVLSNRNSYLSKGAEKDCVRGRNTVLRNARTGQDTLAVFLY